jgi:hypothetical protein
VLTAARGCIVDVDARMKLRAITYNNLGCFYKVLHSRPPMRNSAIAIALQHRMHHRTPVASHTRGIAQRTSGVAFKSNRLVPLQQRRLRLISAYNRLRAIKANTHARAHTRARTDGVQRRNKLHSALQYLEKALKIELASREVDNPAGWACARMHAPTQHTHAHTRAHTHHTDTHCNAVQRSTACYTACCMHTLPRCNANVAIFAPETLGGELRHVPAV